MVTAVAHSAWARILKPSSSNIFAVSSYYHSDLMKPHLSLWALPVKPDPLHFVLGEPFLRPVVKLGRARALARRHFLRVLERATVGEIGGDPGRAERMASDPAAFASLSARRLRRRHPFEPFNPVSGTASPCASSQASASAIARHYIGVGRRRGGERGGCDDGGKLVGHGEAASRPSVIRRR